MNALFSNYKPQKFGFLSYTAVFLCGVSCIKHTVNAIFLFNLFHVGTHLKLFHLIYHVRIFVSLISIENSFPSFTYHNTELENIFYVQNSGGYKS